jgi:hypothetical protein
MTPRLSGSPLSCAQRDSDAKHTKPKRKRGFRQPSPRLRFGLVWLVRHSSVNCYAQAVGPSFDAMNTRCLGNLATSSSDVLKLSASTPSGLAASQVDRLISW